MKINKDSDRRFGFHSIESIIKLNPHKIKKLFVPYSRKDKRIEDLIDLAKKYDIKYEHSKKLKQDPEALIKKEVLLSFKDLKEFLVNDNNYLLLVIDNVIDPRNLGACLRSAAVLNVDGVIINKHHCAPLNEVAHNVSAGGIEALKIYHVSNLINCIKHLRSLDINIFGLSEHASNNFFEMNFKESCALIVGSEEIGVRKKTLEACNYNICLSDNNDFKSFNVSVATGIILSEAIRQRKC